ncbi:MAG: hypothetical protein H0W76_14910 [Pyrinomonadaceae bacterium]|nr:hypothetical protein [Pyrinomonadaceae bacterium]
MKALKEEGLNFNLANPDDYYLIVEWRSFMVYPAADQLVTLGADVEIQSYVNQELKSDTKNQQLTGVNNAMSRKPFS